MHNFGGGRSDLSNSGGGGQKGGEGTILKIQGELAKMGELKNSRGVWTLDEAMVYPL